MSNALLPKVLFISTAVYGKNFIFLKKEPFLLSGKPLSRSLVRFHVPNASDQSDRPHAYAKAPFTRPKDSSFDELFQLFTIVRILELEIHIIADYLKCFKNISAVN